jgi:nickel/cobalt exporter
MWQIFIGSLALSVIHGLIPNHWIPLIAISKSEKWTTRETLFATFFTGISHMASTILLGVIVGFAGIKLSQGYEFIAEIAAPAALILIGIVYILIDLKAKHHHHFELNAQTIKNKKSKTAILISLCLAMFLSPCIEIEAFYFQAGTLGWLGILIVSLVYLVVTLTVMLTLVYLGLQGINKFNSHFLEHHEKRITGSVLILLGIIAYFAEF